MSENAAPYPNQPGFAPVPPAPQPPKQRRTWLTVLIGVGSFVIVGALVWVIMGLVFPGSQQDKIEKGVEQVKSQFSLPKQVDQVTTWTAIEAEDGAIHYEYELASGVDPSMVPVESLRSTVAPTVCSTQETKKLLDEDIAMHYTYAFADGGQPVDFTVTKADC